MKLLFLHTIAGLTHVDLTSNLTSLDLTSELTTRPVCVGECVCVCACNNCIDVKLLPSILFYSQRAQV